MASSQPTRTKKKLTRLGSFSSREVFRTWANDSLLKRQTVETLMEVHQVDSLPSVLALRSKDIAKLELPIGQARLFEQAVYKLHAEYKYVELPSPATSVDVEIPRYKYLLEDVQKTPENEPLYEETKMANAEENNEMLCVDEGETQRKLLDENIQEQDETQTGCACERWLFVIIAMPFLLIVSLLGFIAWVLLWPVNKFSNSGKAFAKVYNSIHHYVMCSPCEACRWAAGRRRDGDEERNKSSAPKSNYGGTDKIEMQKPQNKN